MAVEASQTSFHREYGAAIERKDEATEKSLSFPPALRVEVVG
jgi:hypothetical protein